MYLVDVTVSEILDNKDLKSGVQFKTQRRVISIDLGEFEFQEDAESYMKAVHFHSPSTDMWHNKRKGKA